MISNMEKARENRLRRFAGIQQCRLVKSGRRETRAWDYGRWWLEVTEEDGSARVHGSAGNRVGGKPGLTIDEVEALLYGDAYV